MKKFKVLFKPEPEGGFTAYVPSLPGCISYGETLEKARLMIADALKCFSRCMKGHEECLNDDSDCLIEEITIPDE